MTNPHEPFNPNQNHTPHTMKQTTNTVIIKRKPGRPSKADATKLALLKATADAVALAEKALAEPVKKATKEKRAVKPFDPKEYNGVFSGIFPRTGRDHEVVVVGRRKTRYRGKTHEFIDLRLFFYHFEKQQWFPTQKGVTIPIDKSPDFITAVANAVTTSVA